MSGAGAAEVASPVYNPVAGTGVPLALHPFSHFSLCLSALSVWYSVSDKFSQVLNSSFNQLLIKQCSGRFSLAGDRGDLQVEWEKQDPETFCQLRFETCERNLRGAWNQRKWEIKAAEKWSFETKLSHVPFSCFFFPIKILNPTRLLVKERTKNYTKIMRNFLYASFYLAIAV